jgi:hypothetical protein
MTTHTSVLAFVSSKLPLRLKQFEPADRAVAYSFVKRRLVYFLLPEIQRLVDNFIPEVVTPNLRTVVHRNSA